MKKWRWFQTVEQNRVCYCKSRGSGISHRAWFWVELICPTNPRAFYTWLPDAGSTSILRCRCRLPTAEQALISHIKSYSVLTLAGFWGRVQFKQKTSVIYFIYLTLKEEIALEKQTLGYELNTGDFCLQASEKQIVSSKKLCVCCGSIVLNSQAHTHSHRLTKEIPDAGGLHKPVHTKPFFQCALLCPLLMCWRKASLNESPKGRQRIWHNRQCETSSHMWTHSDQTRVTAVKFLNSTEML